MPYITTYIMITFGMFTFKTAFIWIVITDGLFEFIVLFTFEYFCFLAIGIFKYYTFKKSSILVSAGLRGAERSLTEEIFIKIIKAKCYSL